jgi:hypothetical protein
VRCQSYCTYWMRPSQSVSRNWNLPMRRLTRPMTL